MISYDDDADYEIPDDEEWQTILSLIQDTLDLIRTLKNPVTGNGLDGFSCSMNLKLESGNMEVWEVEFIRKNELDDLEDYDG